VNRDLVRHLRAFDLSEEHVMSTPLRSARASMVPFRVAEGFAPIPVSPLEFLTCPSDNLKLSHSSSDRVAGYGLSLAPADASGWNVCRYATAGCRSACLATSGNGRYDSSTRGRIWKTRWLAGDPVSFLRYLAASIDAIPVAAWAKAGWTVSLRFNVLSDLPWETIAPWLVARAQARGIALYDYTKWPTARRSGVAGYELCQSAHEGSTDAAIGAAAHPVVVVDVKRGAALPTSYLGRPVVDGDRSDARFLDPAGSVVLLRFKEVQTTKRADAVASGFVRTVAA
jgi:hypothetical protein